MHGLKNWRPGPGWVETVGLSLSDLCSESRILGKTYCRGNTPSVSSSFYNCEFPATATGVGRQSNGIKETGAEWMLAPIPDLVCTKKLEIETC